MTSNSDLDAALRRIKPERRRSPLRRRPSLTYVSDEVAPAEIGPVLLDTCVYLDAARRKLSPGAQRLVAGSHLFHSSVCVAELTYTFGRLNSTHPATPQAHALLRDILDEIRPYRTLAPSRAAYLEAGIIVGTLARTQSLNPPDRRGLLLDALIFLTARAIGCPVLTANCDDFDLIQQLAPQGKVLYY